MENKPSVVMMGLGYIGLPTAALISSRGLSVTGVDISQNVVDTINRGEIHIVEPDLDGLVHYVVKKRYLKAATAPVVADVYLIAVPTPFKGDHVPDLSYVLSATKSIIPTLTKGALVILESTSPVGTTQKMLDTILIERPELENEIYVAYCPERVLPGNVLHELKHNDRAIGGIDDASTQKAISFYKHFVVGELHPTNARTAEMVKLVENASRDNQIAFANELSMICDKAEINVWDMIALANKHPRVNILRPGTGVGGHCIAVDPWFIVAAFPEQSKVIRTAREVNNYKTEWAIEKVKNQALQFKIAHNRDAIIACMGLAFKPDIDDLRESPALYLTEQLEVLNHRVLRVEPNIESTKAQKIYAIDDAVEKADIIVFLVAHSEFKNLTKSENKIIIDFVGLK
ncbi:UDP-N-acetyl-D-mannosamine dehydrogenase [Patiriisocius sp. Uisw_017]|jgi:UDP-N-acetyl-D-mannosaminuronic acid dehydrogenase|uniref:UDP-N-acetyl-D-mannosamine dehydrogenase n=1 Tax=Patiriisocius sp. Uisw_017 TaxID=3230968 RepID=UPI0039EBC544